jgi:hypothetical protein
LSLSVSGCRATSATLARVAGIENTVAPIAPTSSKLKREYGPQLWREAGAQEFEEELGAQEWELHEQAQEFEHQESAQEVAHEISYHEIAHHEALAEIMAEAASHEQNEAQAEAMMGAAVMTALSPRDRRALQRLARVIPLIPRVGRVQVEAGIVLPLRLSQILRSQRWLPPQRRQSLMAQLGVAG